MSSGDPRTPLNPNSTPMQSRIPQQVQTGMENLVTNDNPAANMSMPQQASSPPKYVRVWEGNLSGLREGQPLHISRLEGYRMSSASETLAANWPPTLQIVRVISQDYMYNKQHVGRADFLVFRAMNQHRFYPLLHEKKLCAVIELPSQTLLLGAYDKPYHLIGMLFPRDTVVFKTQNTDQRMQQQNRLQLLQHQQQLLQQIQDLLSMCINNNNNNN